MTLLALWFHFPEATTDPTTGSPPPTSVPSSTTGGRSVWQTTAIFLSSCWKCLLKCWKQIQFHENVCGYFAIWRCDLGANYLSLGSPITQRIQNCIFRATPPNPFLPQVLSCCYLQSDACSSHFPYFLQSAANFLEQGLYYAIMLHVE